MTLNVAVCATALCGKGVTGKSKYCREHREVAREAWLAKVRNGAEERQIRDEKHASLWNRAVAAARKAHAEAIPNPMVVVEKVGLSNENTGRSYFVSEGPCGFGYVKVMPGNSSFAIWLTRNGYAHKSYTGGVRISTNYGSQSIARAAAAADAMANVLYEAGIKAYSGSDLD